MFGKFTASSTVAIQVAGSTDEVEFRDEVKARHAQDVILPYAIHG
jgi:hypothetical protein